MATGGDEPGGTTPQRLASCQRWPNTRELFCAPKADLEVVAPSQLCPRVFSPGSTRKSSRCCWCVSTSLYLQPRASSLRRQEFWGDVVILLKLAQVASAGKRAHVKTNVLVRDIDLGVPVHDRAECSWPLTPCVNPPLRLRRRSDRRCCLCPSTPTQRAHIPRIGRPAEARKAGGPSR